MAEMVSYQCNHSRQRISAWSDGNPYYIDDQGNKVYAYHPDHEGLPRCTDNDNPYICLECGHEFKNDSNTPTSMCPECGNSDICGTFRLGGRRCPFCKKGVFDVDLSEIVVS